MKLSIFCYFSVTLLISFSVTTKVVAPLRCSPESALTHSLALHHHANVLGHRMQLALIATHRPDESSTLRNLQMRLNHCFFLNVSLQAEAQLQMNLQNTQTLIDQWCLQTQRKKQQNVWHLIILCPHSQCQSAGPNSLARLWQTGIQIVTLANLVTIPLYYSTVLLHCTTPLFYWHRMQTVR